MHELSTQPNSAKMSAETAVNPIQGQPSRVILKGGARIDDTPCNKNQKEKSKEHIVLFQTNQVRFAIQNTITSLF